MSEKWYSLEELSQLLSMSIPLLREKCKTRQFPNAKRNGGWRVPECDVEALIPGLEKQREVNGDREGRMVTKRAILEEKKLDKEIAEFETGIITKEQVDDYHSRVSDLEGKEAVLWEREQQVRSRELAIGDCEGAVKDAERANQEEAKELALDRKAVQSDMAKLYEYQHQLIKKLGMGGQITPPKLSINYGGEDNAEEG